MSSIILLANTQTQFNTTGVPARASGWYGYNSNLSTVSISTQNFIGRIYIQATLALNPTEIDWFPIQLIPNSNYIEYPNIAFSPTGLNGGDTSITGYTFKANVLFLRAKIDRSYLIYQTIPTQEQIVLLGNARIVLSI